MADDKKDVVDQINLKVVGQDGGVVLFKIKKNTALRKLMNAYCSREGLNVQNVRFRFDGQPINETDTPAGLDMEDDDSIDVFQQQTGGLLVHFSRSSSYFGPTIIKIKVVIADDILLPRDYRHTAISMLPVFLILVRLDLSKVEIGKVVKLTMLLPFIIGSYVLFEVNYFVRVFYTVISSKLRYKKKKYILEEGTSHGICTSTDLDFYWHMNNTRYLREFEFGRTAFGVANGIWKAAKQTGCRGVMSAVSIRYRRSITIFQVFRIKTKIIYWTDRDLYLEQFIETVHDNFIRAVSFNRVTFTGGLTPEAPVRKILELITENNIPELPEIKPDLRCWMESNQLSSEKLRKRD